MIAVVLDGICILTRIKGERQEDGGCILGVDGHSKAMETSLGSSASQEAAALVPEDLLTRFCILSCSQVTMLICPTSVRRDAEETVQSLSFPSSPPQKTFSSFRPLVISPAINTQINHIPETSSHWSLGGFTWRKEVPSTRLLAGLTSQPSLISLSRADPFLLHLAENTVTCWYHCTHVRPAPNRRGFENPNLGPCNFSNRMSSDPLPTASSSPQRCLPFFSPRRAIVTSAPPNGRT